MSVVFDLYLFTELYVEEMRKKEELENHRPDPDVEQEVGAILCRNTGRQQPIFFYSVEELGELVEAGYAVGKALEPRSDKLGLDMFPPDSIIPTIIELDKPVAGRFIDQDGREKPFATRKELAAAVEEQLPARN